MDNQITLNPFLAEDLEFLDRLGRDGMLFGHFNYSGFQDSRAHRRRWEQDGYLSPKHSMIAVKLADGTIAGIASWRAAYRGGPEGIAIEIGMALLVEHQGRGIGTIAQRKLVEHLFAHTTAQRIEAWTDTENIAEQRALEKVGFLREGVMRGVIFQHGSLRDAVSYAVLRGEFISA